MSHLLFFSLIGALLNHELPASFAGPETPVHLLVLGDSQTGAFWASSYFGDFLQKCLSQKTGLRFAMYARGGTQMVHWLGNTSMDSIPTVYRDELTPKKILGKKELPTRFKRARSLLELHRPDSVLLQFGGNLLTLPSAAIETQTRNLVREASAAGIQPENCFLAAPTFEMEVKTRRNVPTRTPKNLKKLAESIERGARGFCRVLDGRRLLEDSPLLRNQALRRIPVPGTSGCLGGAENDNAHVCGEAARAWAEAVCRTI